MTENSLFLLNASLSHSSHDQKRLQKKQHLLLKLPSGWTTHMSKSKGRVYFCHPDFGSTWHCPVVVPEDDFGANGSQSHRSMLDPIEENTESNVSDHDDVEACERSITEQYDFFDESKAKLQIHDHDDPTGSAEAVSQSSKNYEKRCRTSDVSNSTYGMNDFISGAGSEEGRKNSQINPREQNISPTNDAELKSAQRQECVGTVNQIRNGNKYKAKSGEKVINDGKDGTIKNANGSVELSPPINHKGDSLEWERKRLSALFDARHDEVNHYSSDVEQRSNNTRTNLRSQNSDSNSDILEGHEPHCDGDDFVGEFGTHEDSDLDADSGVDERPVSKTSADTGLKNIIEFHGDATLPKNNAHQKCEPMSNSKGKAFERNDIQTKNQKKFQIKRRMPPHPTCSLQFIDMIEEGSLDTPKWRRCKSKPQRKAIKKTRSVKYVKRRRRVRVVK
mmetsp:Transcript_33502/g.49185  ORF Transcript_33502/g.49185 Transcript_33502/m.49185 type:complete len:448 (+) Transcript_33502:556-1899(+)